MGLTLLFIEDEHRKKTRYEHEVTDAKRRAHAARVSWQGRRKSRKDGISTKTSLAKTRTDRAKSLSPTVFAGNSDPFSTWGIEITPQVNLMLTFLRDAVIPATFSTPFFRFCSRNPADTIDLTRERQSSIISHENARREWLSIVACLQDEGRALAALAVHVDKLPAAKKLCLAGSNSDFHTSLALRTRSMHLLHEKIKNDEAGDFTYSEAAIRHVLLLFRAEITASNRDAATLHGLMLRHLLEKASEQGNLPISLVMVCIAADADHAVKFISSTILDFDDWCVRTLSPVWHYKQTIFPPVPQEVHQGLSRTVDVEPLRSAMVEMRLQLYIGTKHASLFGDPSQSALILPLFITRSYVDKGRLINLCIRLINDTHSVDGALSRGRRYTQAALTLNSIFMLRSWGMAAELNGKDLKDVSPILMSHVRTYAKRMFACCTPMELAHYRDAHLWVLYGGAVWEHRQLFAKAKLGDDKAPTLAISYKQPQNWFSLRLAQFCKNHGVCTVEQLLEIESRFIQTDLLKPRPHTWFEHVIASIS